MEREDILNRWSEKASMKTDSGAERQNVHKCRKSVSGGGNSKCLSHENARNLSCPLAGWWALGVQYAVVYTMGEW